MGSESRLSNSNESGNKRDFILYPNCLQRPVKENFVKLKNYKKFFPSHNSQLNPIIVNTPESYNFIDSAENFDKHNYQG